MAKEKNRIRECLCYTLMLSLCFIIYFTWSLHLPMALAPDESMRYQIPLWIFQHHKLPIGNEPELLNPIWGISYAFFPYTTSLVGVLFMAIASIFTDSANILFHASRLPNVLFGTGTVFFCLLIGKEFFKRRDSKYLFAALVGFLPQFAFLSCYLNNDCFSVFCSAIILLAWVRGVKYGWTAKNIVLLAVGIGFDAISYYNAYGWILCSIFVVFFSIRHDKNLEKKIKPFLKIFFIVFCVAFAIAGWYFVRNFIIYNGDVFGLRTSRLCAELNAHIDFKPSNRLTLKNQGMSFCSILFNRAWHESVIRSFFCVLGGMNIFADDIIYILYFTIVFIGLFVFVLNEKKIQICKKKIILCMLIVCMVVPYFFSMYYSYANDYQAQGRYVISALLPLQLFVAFGYEVLTEKIKKYIPIAITVSVLILYILLFLVVFLTVIYPECWGNENSSKTTVLPSYPVVTRDFQYCIDSEDSSRLGETEISGWAFFENHNCDIYIQANGNYYKAKKVSRIDVKQAFHLKSSRNGFKAIVPDSFSYYQLILVNKSRKEIYCKTIHEELVSRETSPLSGLTDLVG